MSISIDAAELHTGLSHVLKLTKTRTVIPILNCVRMELTNETLILEATDLEVTLRYFIKGVSGSVLNEDSVVQGSIVVNSQKLHQIIKKLKKQKEILLWVTENKLYIQKGTKTFYLLLDDPDEFPIIPIKAGKDFIEISEKNFVNRMNKTLFAVAKDMSCYSYNGLLLEISPEKELVFVATDGRRLAIFGDFQETKTSDTKSHIVPIKAVNLVLGMIKKPKDDSNLYIDYYKNPIQFALPGRFEVMVRVLEGNFPSFRDAIPDYNTKSLDLIIKRAEMLDALDTCGLTAGHEVRSVNIRLTKDFKIVLSSDQEGIGGTSIKLPVSHGDVPAVRVTEVRDGVDVGVTKQDYFYEEELTINPDFLTDYLKVLDSEDVEFFIQDYTSVIRVESSSIKDDGSFYIVMPITSK